MQHIIHGRANYSDCDYAGRLKVSAAMRYMQQASSEHLEKINLSPVKLREENMAFMLTKTCIRIHRMPRIAECIRTGTSATGLKGARFIREFAMDSQNGERLISAYSLWMLVNPKTKKVLRPTAFPYPLPMEESVLNGVIGDAPIPKVSHMSGAKEQEIDISYSHIDVNTHVNNSFYADFACNCLPFDSFREGGLDTLVIDFQREAREGDKIKAAALQFRDREYYIKGIHDRGVCFEALAVLK